MNAPEAIQAFAVFDKAALAEGAIPGKYKELMASRSCSRPVPELHRDPREQGARDRLVYPETPRPWSSLRRCVRVRRSPTARTP